MRLFLSFAFSLCAMLFPLHAEETPVPQQKDAAPRWLFLGNDHDLRETIAGSDHVLLICVYRTDLENVKPPFAQIVLSATVVKPIKSTHAMGDKITIRFTTDSLPADEAERSKFIDAAAKNHLGALKLAFLSGGKPGAYTCEWLHLPPYSPEMLDFVWENRDVRPEPSPPDKVNR